MATKPSKKEHTSGAKKRRSSRRRKLIFYSKAPFNLTDEHHKAFLSAVDRIAISEVTYKLTLDRTSVQRVSFGGRSATLTADRTSDPNVFESSTPMSVPITDGMLWVVIRADGRFSVGGGWELKVFVDGTEIPDSPISEDIQSNNKADHDERHSV